MLTKEQRDAIKELMQPEEGRVIQMTLRLSNRTYESNGAKEPVIDVTRTIKTHDTIEVY